MDVEWVTWRGLFVPGNISDARYLEWVELFTALAESPEWDEARRVNRWEQYVVVGDDFDALVKNQVREFREMSREIGLIR